MGDSDSILVEASTNQAGLPVVLVIFEGHTEEYSSEDARKFANTLIMAAAIAENEAAIFNGTAALDKKSKGFGEPKRPSTEKIAAEMIFLLRRFRPELGFKIQAFFGMRTKQPIVKFPWPSREELQLNLDQARSHAANMLGAAEAAETDAFLRHFMRDKIQVGDTEAQGMVLEFRDFRSRTQLEMLFSKS